MSATNFSDVIGALVARYADTINRLCNERDELKAALANSGLERDEARAENTRLRAAMAMSDQPCVYCTLPAEEWAKCCSGFPGCARADDAVGCPHLGAGLLVDALAADLERAREMLKFMAKEADRYDPDEDDDDYLAFATSLTIGQLRAARAFLASGEKADG